MNRMMLGIAIALMIAGEATVLAQSLPVVRSSAHPTDLSGCPYYPSQALCSMRPSPTTTGSAAPRRTVPGPRNN
jgi:hypothetical protein